MHKGQRRIFTDPKVIQEMLEKYARGASLSDLSRDYNCNHTVIRYHLLKNGFHLRGKQKAAVFKDADPIPLKKEIIIEIEKGAEGKMYEEYLNQMRLSRMKKFRCFKTASPWGIPTGVQKKEAEGFSYIGGHNKTTRKRDQLSIGAASTEAPNQDPELLRESPQDDTF